jgi:hypothetical protein
MTAELRPPAGDWRSIVWTSARSGAAPFTRSLQPASAARLCAALSVRPTRCETRHVRVARAAGCAVALANATKSNGRDHADDAALSAIHRTRTLRRQVTTRRLLLAPLRSSNEAWWELPDA